MAVLLREAIGDRLRRTRTLQHRTLREVSRTARVSLGYLSEVERGRKEASSELLAAICDALSLPLSDLMHSVAGDLTPHLADGAGMGPMDAMDSLDSLEKIDSIDGVLEGGRLVPASTGDSKAELLLGRPLPHPIGGSVSSRAVVVAA
jgi:transcriptional regulator with XRE-family HTH domain